MLISEKQAKDINRYLKKLEKAISNDGRIVIEIMHNGAAVKCSAENLKEAFQFDDDDQTGLVSLLYQIRSLLGDGGRYAKQRIEIKIVHGDKYECKDKKCKICGKDKQHVTFIG